MAKKGNKKAEAFWNLLDEETKKEILGGLSKQYNLELEYIPDPFKELPESHKYHITNYYHQVIEPQEGKQQTKYDGTIREEMPSELTCPRCGAPAYQVMTKRGIHFKCQNEACGWDTNRPFDFSRGARDSYVDGCAQVLKGMFPEFNFVRNFPYSSDAVLTGVFKEGVTNYDVGVYYFGNKLQRLRVEINRNISQKQFMETENDIYVIGRKELVEKLASRDGVVVHYLIDEQMKRVGMSRLKVIRDNCPQSEDRFKNIQYAIPKKVRPFVVTFDWKEMRRLLTLEYYEILTRNMMIK